MRKRIFLPDSVSIHTHIASNLVTHDTHPFDYQMPHPGGPPGPFDSTTRCTASVDTRRNSPRPWSQYGRSNQCLYPD